MAPASRLHDQTNRLVYIVGTDHVYHTELFAARHSIQKDFPAALERY